MQTEQYIAADELCAHYNISVTFINTLHSYGLLEVNTIENKSFVDAGQLRELEKLIHLHYELDINMEGLEAIGHLLQKVELLQQEIISLKHRLHLYEPGGYEEAE